MAETTDQNSSGDASLVMPTPEQTEAAEKLKAEANEHFKNEKFGAAVDLYSQAIQLNPVNAVYYANRSIANHRLENFGYALADASKALELDKSYLKAYYRRAAAYMSLGKYKMALKDYERVYKVRPNDSDAKAKFTECKKIVNQDGITLDEIRKTERNRQPPEEGIMCELLWSDPQPMPGRAPSKRGVGCQFGPDVTAAFLANNGLDYIVRSHEVKDDGYEVTHDGKCITVFSAPNYCDSMGNKGAFITLTGSTTSKMDPKFTTYEAVPHPNVKPMAYANSLLSLFM